MLGYSPGIVAKMQLLRPCMRKLVATLETLVPGSQVVLRDEPDCGKLAAHGASYSLQGGRQIVEPGLPTSACHTLAAHLYAMRGVDTIPKDLRIATGYYLLTDNLWRQHSWNVAGRGAAARVVMLVPEPLGGKLRALWGVTLTQKESNAAFRQGFGVTPGVHKNRVLRQPGT
jgi:hypothetical protein